MMNLVDEPSEMQSCEAKFVREAMFSHRGTAWVPTTKNSNTDNRNNQSSYRQTDDTTR